MIETNRLYIMDAVEADIEAIMEMERHKDNREYVWSGTYEEHKAEIVADDLLLFTISQKDDSTMVGFALSALDRKSDVYELRRIVISKKGMGYGKEVMEALIKDAFENRSINRFWLDVYPDNRIGISLYEKLGMHCDGVLRQSYKSANGYKDQKIYSMLRDEYFRKKNN